VPLEQGGATVRRRVLYVILGAVTLNLVLMSIMFVQMREEPKCDANTRGLALRLNDGRWVTLQSPLEASDLPPCRAKLTQRQVEILPG